MIRHPTDSLLVFQRSKWPPEPFEREESMGQVMIWILLPLGALLSLGACALSLSPFSALQLARLLPLFYGDLP